MKADIILSRNFTFEAAHSLDLPDGTDPDYKNLHGHSFSASISFKGPQADIDKWLLDFGSLDPVIEKIRAKLDHAYLNDIEGLKYSTLENLCAYIFKLADPMVPGLHAVEISRHTCGQTCKLVVDN